MTRLRDLQGGVTKLRYASDISRSTSSMCVGVTGRSLCDRARVPSSVGFLELISLSLVENCPSDYPPCRHCL